MSLFEKRSLRLLVWYGLFLFIPAFLYLAYNYISAKSPQYKVSASISLAGVSQQSAIAELKSKALISKVLDKMPLQASYFFADQPKKEIYPDSSPVKVTVKKLDSTPVPVLVSLRAIDKRQFELTRGDTSEFYKFSVPVTESFGTFTVMPNEKAGSIDKPVNVKMVSRTQMMNVLYNDLYVGNGHKQDIVRLALITGNPKKGVDVLNTLLNIYGGMIYKAVDDTPVARTITTVQYDTIRKPGKDVTGLKDKTTELTRQIASLKEQEKNSGNTVQVSRGNIDKGQAKIYQAIDSYIKHPIDQFVQVPYVDEIENPELNDAVNEFNETELARRRLTSQSQIDSINRKLMTLRSNIAEQTRAYLRNGHSESNSQLSKSYYEEQIAAKQRRLDELNKEIQTAGGPSFTVVKSNKTQTVNTNSPSGSKLVIVDKPEENVEYIPVKSALIYSLALLAGLLFPIAGWIVRIVHRNSSSRRAANREKPSGQLNDLFQVKQVD